MVKIRGFDGLIFKPELYQQLLCKNMEYLEDCQLLHSFNTQEWINKGLLYAEKEEFLYLYQQEFLGLVTLGLLAQLSLEDYQNRKIKKHEKTLIRPHLNQQTYSKQHVGPVIVGHEHMDKIDSILHALKNSQSPLAEWKTVDGRRHKLWRVGVSKELIQHFATVESLYIMDGHHRFQAALGHLEKQDENVKQKTKWIQGLVYSIKYIRSYPQFRELVHEDYNTIVRNLMQNKKLLFTEIPHYDANSLQCDLVLLYNGKFFQIKSVDPSAKNNQKSGVEQLDQILKQAFEAAQSSSHNGIKFVPSIKFDWSNVQGQTYPIFLVKSPSISTIFSIADQDQVLPPKSTWLEPKPCLHMVIRVPY